MSATVLTIEAARAAKIDVIENGKYTQAVHDVVVAMRAARRSGSANTKSKADVNLSGAKPWRQKGTGRARAGYKSSPVWVGGGVAFGPKPRDYSKKVPKSVKRVALRKAISERIKDGDILMVDALRAATNCLVFGCFTTKASTIKISPSLMRSEIALRNATRFTDFGTFLE